MTDKTTTADALALRLLALSELAKRVAQARDTIKKALTATLTVGDTKRPLIPGDARNSAGSVSYAKGRVSARVAETEPFTAWCAEHYPEAVEIVPTVQPWLVKAILDASAEAGQGVAPDGTMGVPGIKIGETSPSISSRPSRTLTDDQWRAIIAPQLAVVSEGADPTADAE